MKVLCINNDNIDSTDRDFKSALTIGNWYEVDYEFIDAYKVLCNFGWYLYVNKTCFITEKENRKLKLQKINDRGKL